MKSKDLLNQIKFVSKAAVKTDLPIVEYLVFKDGFIYAGGDLYTWAFIKTEIRSNFLIGRREITNILKKVKNSDINFELDGTKVAVLIDGNPKFKFAQDDLKDYPAEPFNKNWEEAAQLSGSDMEKIKKSLKYVANDELRPAMTGVKLSAHIVTTNGHILYFTPSENFNDDFVLRPLAARVLTQKNIGPVTVYKSGYHWRKIDNGDCGVITKIIDERYPDWKSVLPEKFEYSANVKKEDLINTLDLALIAANKVTNQIALEGCDGVKITSGDIDLGSEFCDTISGRVENVFRIGFNGKFLSSIVKDVESESITIKGQAPHRGHIINDEFLLMPIMSS